MAYVRAWIAPPGYADTVAKTSDVNDNVAGAVTAEFIRDQLRLEALQT